MYLPFFVSFLFPLFSISIFSALYFLNWYYLILSIKRHFACIYNPSRILNVRCMKSKDIRLRFIASSSRTSMSYLSQLRAILYFSNNTSIFANLNEWFTNIRWILFRWRSYILFEFQYIAWTIDITVSQNEADVEWSIFWRMK